MVKVKLPYACVLVWLHQYSMFSWMLPSLYSFVFWLCQVDFDFLVICASPFCLRKPFNPTGISIRICIRCLLGDTLYWGQIWTKSIHEGFQASFTYIVPRFGSREAQTYLSLIWVAVGRASTKQRSRIGSMEHEAM